MSLSTPVDAYAPSSEKESATVPVMDRWFGSWRVSLHRRAYTADELRTTYDCEAPTWRNLVKTIGVEEAYANAFVTILRRGAFSLSARQGRILDCGAGDGAFSSAAAKTFPARISAVDLSPEMLACAEKRLSAEGVKAEYHVADARSLPFPDNHFDVVVTAHMLEHLPDPEVALREIHRVLKPGGSLVASITRPSLVGRWIQLSWRTHTFSRKGGEKLLSDQGFDQVWSLATAGHVIFDCFSIVYAARKPLC